MRDKRECLVHYKSLWINGKTTTLRVPIVLKDDISDYAKCIDNGSIKYNDVLEVYQYLKGIKDKLGIENGYKSNNSGKLIKSLSDLMDTLVAKYERVVED